jgi:hypothetical protein
LRLPPGVYDLCRFSNDMFKRLHKSHNVIKNSLTAVRSLVVQCSLDPSPFDSELLAHSMKGIKAQDPKRAPKTKRLPITIWSLERCRSVVCSTDLSETIPFHAMVVGVHGLFRASEIVSKPPYGACLLRKHVTVLLDRVIIHLIRSKTDSYDQGVDITLYANYGPLCPVRHITAAMSAAPSQDPEDAVFQSPKGTPLTYKSFQASIKCFCIRAGIGSANYSTHSLRIGGATSLMALGYSAENIMVLGRWKSLAYADYIRLCNDLPQRVSQTLGKATGGARPNSASCGYSLDEFANFNSSNIAGFTPFCA